MLKSKIDPVAALTRLATAARIVADALDSGERDPTWHETQELEAAAIEYGRAVRERDLVLVPARRRTRRPAQ